MPNIIHPNQTAYMKNRFIGMNIRSVQDVISDSISSGTIVLFLDFCKAFDSVNHLFMFTLLAHMGFPPEFISWIALLYTHAISVVKYNNWLTEPFNLLCRVHQGCHLSCHLFNLVGQVLIFSLRDFGYFEWWHFMNDPCSLYADDTAIFLSNLAQMKPVLDHIALMGSFTGLRLNLEKTIAFDLSTVHKLLVSGICVCNAPVKYLGAFLGLGDLSHLNFEQPLKKARAVIGRWLKHSLTLDARILVIKTFIFSVFVHILNTVSVSSTQMDIMQKMVTDFLWRGRSRVKLSTMMADYACGGLKMLHVRNVVHALRVKWMQHFSLDMGLTWSRLAWPAVTCRIPPELFQGLCHVLESALCGLDQFYSSMLHSYTYVSNLFYKANKELDLPINLWGHPKSQSINIQMCQQEYFTVADLPVTSGIIDHKVVQNKFLQNKSHYCSFLVCYQLQSCFQSRLGSLVKGSYLVHEDLILQLKALLLQASSSMLSLTNWEIYFWLMPMSLPVIQMIFKRMLQACKYIQFREINFKILTHILVTPKILSMVKADQAIAVCHWYGAIGTLEHILLECPEVVKTRTCFVTDNSKILLKWKTKYWIFGTASAEINQIIWVVNFVIYKAVLRVLEGYNDDLRILVSSECVHYQELFPILTKIV